MSERDRLMAAKMWELGLDTFDIADVLDVSEATLANEFLAPGMDAEAARLADVAAITPASHSDLGGLHG